MPRILACEQSVLDLKLLFYVALYGRWMPLTHLSPCDLLDSWNQLFSIFILSFLHFSAILYCISPVLGL